MTPCTLGAIMGYRVPSTACEDQPSPGPLQKFVSRVDLHRITEISLIVDRFEFLKKVLLDRYLQTATNGDFLLRLKWALQTVDGYIQRRPNDFAHGALNRQLSNAIHTRENPNGVAPQHIRSATPEERSAHRILHQNEFAASNQRPKPHPCHHLQ